MQERWVLMSFNYRLFIFVLLAVGVILFITPVRADNCCVIPSRPYCIDNRPCTADGEFELSPASSCTAMKQELELAESGAGQSWWDDECSAGCCCFKSGPDTSPIYSAQVGAVRTLCELSQGTFKAGTSNCDVAHCQGLAPTTYSIHGTIYDSNHLPVSSTTVKIPGGSVAMSLASGLYTFTGVTKTTSAFTITANKSGCIGSLRLDNGVQTDLVSKDITLDCCHDEPKSWSACDPITHNQSRIVNTVCGVTVTKTWIENQSCQLKIPCEWNCTWTPDCPNSDGFTISHCTEIPDGCNVHVAPPPVRLQCPTDLYPDCNHDGIVQSPKEECDYNVTSGVFNAPASDNCPFPRNNSMSNCDFATCKCIPPPSTPDDCANNPDILTAPLDVNIVPMERAFKLGAWTFATNRCLDYIDHFEIIRYLNTSTGIYTFNANVNLSVTKTTRLYKDNTTSPKILANTQYCYELTMVYNASVVNPTLRKQTIKGCKMSGDDICMSPHLPTWCDFSPVNHIPNTIVWCDGANNITADEGNCTANTYCTMGPSGAVCIPQGQCDKCNNLFSVFGNQLFPNVAGNSYSYNRINNDSIDEKYVLCPTLVNPDPQVAPDKVSEDLGGCYLDYTTTIFDMAYPCTNVTSCYDYKSQGACVNDYCKKFITNSAGLASDKCEWVFYSTDLYKGVCRPKDPTFRSEQNCTLCGIQSINRIYPDCTKDTCTLFGYCFYKNNLCADGSTIHCSNYLTQQECTGSDTLPGFTVDVPPANAYGTNSITALSKDVPLNISRCRWIASGCIKDADNNNLDDCKSETSQPKICERDITPPISHVINRSVYALMMDFHDMSIIDDGPWTLGDDTPSYSIDYLMLHYCIFEDYPGADCYPNNILHIKPASSHPFMINLSEFKNHDNTVINAASNGKKYIMKYFAEDVAKNLEVVKSFNFTLDALPPKINLTIIHNAFPQGSTWKTNLTFIIRLDAEDYPPVQCNFYIRPTYATVDFSGMSFYDINNLTSIYRTNISRVGWSISTMYPYLSESYYDYNLTCTDVAGNIYQENKTIKVEGDLTINDAEPSLAATYRSTGYGTLSAPENMSIHTTYPGTCRYSDTTTNYSLMTGAFDNNYMIADKDYFHSTKLKIRSTDASGVYRYYTACNLTVAGVQKIITGDDVDMIYFAIDDLAPVTKVLYEKDTQLLEYHYNASEFNDSMTVTLNCSDSDPRLIEDYTIVPGQPPYYRDRSFQCDKTYICIKRANDTISCGNMLDMDMFHLYDKSPIFFNYTDETNSLDKERYGNAPYICYYSIDNGNNTENDNGKAIFTRINVRNGLFLSPIINISSGD